MNESKSPPSMAGSSGYPRGGSGAAEERYAALANDMSLRHHKLSFVIPARTGKAFEVMQGEICRISCPEGPQVADTIVFNLDDLTEKFWAARTRVVHGVHLKIGAQLLSTPPQTRPMMTMIADSLKHAPLDGGARSHDLLFCRCDARLYELVHKRPGSANCNDNLATAIGEFGLGPLEVHDPFNIFMTTGLNVEGRPFYLPSDARKGDFVELFADMNCLVAISACPGGSSGSVSRPLQVDLFTTT
jgi:uncharacterized protein YcgI (DUF1989 family)